MSTTECPDTTDGQHDWDEFERPSRVYYGDLSTTRTPAMKGRTCHWCGETEYTEAGR